MRIECRVAGRRRQPVPGAGGADRRRAARRRAGPDARAARCEGNAYAAGDRPRVPTTLRDARDAVRGAARVARDAFGDEVVDHYVNTADVELAAFGAAVTDWERVRGFERL